MKTTKYIFHSDPGHGWLEVQRRELEALGIAGEISGYSYQQGDAIYLEEDCDASLFIAAKEAAGEKVEYEESFKNHTPIRNYNSYTAKMDKQEKLNMPATLKNGMVITTGIHNILIVRFMPQ